MVEEIKMNLGNIERMSREFVANSHEFLYGDNFPVKKGTRYIIFYTKAKIEKFITRKWEEIFIKNPDKHYTLFVHQMKLIYFQHYFLIIF